MAKSLKKRLSRLEKMISDFFIGDEKKPAGKGRKSARQRPAARRKPASKGAKRTTSRKVSRA